MDKDSQPPPQPSTGSSRRTRSGRARSVSTPSAPSNASSISSSPATQSYAGLDPGWHPQPLPAPPLPSGPRSYEEVARALQTIQEAYPLLAQSMTYHQQGPTLPTVPPQLPWPPAQPSTSHGVAIPQQTSDFGQFYLPSSGYSPATPPFPIPALSTPITSIPGESSFQAFTSTQEGTPVDTDATAEEKRRRNTAASARFRVKKKLRAFNLERTVTDLTGRVDELEQEAADLRRENGWLKEIVMLKSTRVRGGEPVAGPSQPSGSRNSKDKAEEGQSPDDEGGESDAA
ncbi:hypothetical protein EDB86DRAFT_3072570 [Lactarius hatsudake]|nr:hypothetical protein EDB86DRAFT_3072570 [Lactarius hatsudake]